MKKTLLLLISIFALTASAGDATTFNAELLTIKSQTSAETIGVVFNPSDANLEGVQVSVKTLALPATNGPFLIKNLRTIMNKIQAIYLVEGNGVTTPKLARFVVKNAQRYGVTVYTNDAELEGIEGVNLVRVDADGAIVVEEQEQAD